MANITITDLELNAALDKKALKAIAGGRWVRRVYYQRYYAYFYRTVRRAYRVYRTVRIRVRQLRVRRIVRWVWI